MNVRLMAAAILLCMGIPAFAHRLDEYLQATIISVEKSHVQAQLRLTPGVAVLPIVLPNIDTDGDGIISESEQQAYAEQVLRDLSLAIDGNPLRLRLVSKKFAGIGDMKEGLGEIQLNFIADLPGGGYNRTLRFENHHQKPIGAYLVNCLMPRDPDIQISGQHRNYQQSVYELDYAQAGSLAGWSAGGGFLGAGALLLFARLAFDRRRRLQRLFLST